MKGNEIMKYSILTESPTGAKALIDSRLGSNLDFPFLLLSNNDPIALFIGPNGHTNAQKICDLLNETSKSQGSIQNEKII